MSHVLLELILFTSKAVIIFFIIMLVLITFFVLLAKSKEKIKEGRLVIKNLNKKYAEAAETILNETLSKKLFKKTLKANKAAEKIKAASEEKSNNVFVLNFQGDIKASAVSTLSEEITMILTVATPADEVIVKIESAGGVVHGYGLAAAQLMRLRAKQIPLTVTIDKIAASGGYLMACVANKILCAPFAIIGSIGVIVQLPNLHRYLKNKSIDFEQLTAGEYKRTITVFGENTEAGREKLQHELEDVHQLFKQLISEHRQQIDIQKVATGEHWLGKQALGLHLVDEISTSDDYLLASCKQSQVFEICYEVKKPFLSKLSATANLLKEKALASLLK